ncbi:uncharacterized protein J8A68_005136 [[Candida] subhashii]|uniref:Uncharacterized protein n=1 Tax=[Candida] subhashii TaxID=561895 RepID=A0A8J5QG05_9ASCO|nr:uncharacterized protein J8A68_005136 [[Candida] subhashii]KAG7661344.1 hypothetical protein J8A68_005136 [[Candida] subhashii]
MAEESSRAIRPWEMTRPTPTQNRPLFFNNYTAAATGSQTVASGVTCTGIVTSVSTITFSFSDAPTIARLNHLPGSTLKLETVAIKEFINDHPELFESASLPTVNTVASSTVCPLPLRKNVRDLDNRLQFFKHRNNQLRRQASGPPTPSQSAEASTSTALTEINTAPPRVFKSANPNHWNNDDSNNKANVVRLTTSKWLISLRQTMTNMN